MIDAPKDLKDRYREGRLVPFIGAGVSMSVNWAESSELKRGLSWAELVDEAARLLGFSDPDLLRVRGNDLQILEYYKLKNNDEVAQLRNWILRNMNPPDVALQESAIHAALAAMTKCPLMYTTNYDDFIERALRQHGRRTHAVAVEAHIAKSIVTNSSLSDPSTEIVKFHGDLNNPGRMVLSESDYEKRLKFTDIEDQRLRTDLLGRALLFVGYSFRDWNVSYLFRMVNESFGRRPSCEPHQAASSCAI